MGSQSEDDVSEVHFLLLIYEPQPRQDSLSHQYHQKDNVPVWRRKQRHSIIIHLHEMVTIIRVLLIVHTTQNIQTSTRPSANYVLGLQTLE